MTAHTLLQPFCWLTQIIQSYFFCFRQFYTFYDSSIHHPPRFHHIRFRDGLIGLTCIVFYDVYYLQLRRRRRKKINSFHQFAFFNHFFNLWTITCQTTKFSCRQGHCLTTLKNTVFILFIQLNCDICTSLVKNFRSNSYNAFFSQRYILKIIVKVCIIF